MNRFYFLNLIFLLGFLLFFNRSIYAVPTSKTVLSPVREQLPPIVDGDRFQPFSSDGEILDGMGDFKQNNTLPFGLLDFGFQNIYASLWRKQFPVSLVHNLAWNQRIVWVEEADENRIDLSAYNPLLIGSRSFSRPIFTPEGKIYLIRNLGLDIRLINQMEFILHYNY